MTWYLFFLKILNVIDIKKTIGKCKVFEDVDAFITKKTVRILFGNFQNIDSVWYNTIVVGNKITKLMIQFEWCIKTN